MHVVLRMLHRHSLCRCVCVCLSLPSMFIPFSFTVAVASRYALIIFRIQKREQSQHKHHVCVCMYVCVHMLHLDLNTAPDILSFNFSKPNNCYFTRKMSARHHGVDNVGVAFVESPFQCHRACAPLRSSALRVFNNKLPLYLFTPNDFLCS